MGEVHTHLEGSDVYMREGHCLRGSGSAGKKMHRSKNVEGKNRMNVLGISVRCFDSHSKTCSKGLHVPQSMFQQRTL